MSIFVGRCGLSVSPVNGRFWRIVLKVSFLGDELNFLGPLMRFTHRDVRDQIVLR